MQKKYANLFLCQWVLARRLTCPSCLHWSHRLCSPVDRQPGPIFRSESCPANTADGSWTRQRRPHCGSTTGHRRPVRPLPNKTLQSLRDKWDKILSLDCHELEPLGHLP